MDESDDRTRFARILLLALVQLLLARRAGGEGRADLGLDAIFLIRKGAWRPPAGSAARARPGFALGAAEESPIDEDADSDDEEADEVDPDFDPDDDVTMRDPEPTSRKRKAPPAPRPKRRRKTKAAPVEPVLSEYELGRRAKIKRNNKFLVSVGLLFPR